MSPEFCKAMAAARATFPAIKRDRTVTVQTKTGGKYTFAYAPLDTIMAAILPPLTANGIVLMQDMRGGCVITKLYFGEEVAEFAPINVAAEGLGMQEYGGKLTYAQRYSVKLAFALSTEDDNDGNDPSDIKEVRGKPAKLTAEQEKHAATLNAAGTLQALRDAWKAIPQADRAALQETASKARAAIEAMDKAAGNE
jgi:hypothetical protein